jgi:hypothetical protein
VRRPGAADPPMIQGTYGPRARRHGRSPKSMKSYLPKAGACSLFLCSNRRAWTDDGQPPPHFCHAVAFC